MNAGPSPSVQVPPPRTEAEIREDEAERRRKDREAARQVAARDARRTGRNQLVRTSGLFIPAPN